MPLVRRNRPLSRAAALRSVWLLCLQPVQALRYRYRLSDSDARLFQTACPCFGRMAAQGRHSLGVRDSETCPTAPSTVGIAARTVAKGSQRLFRGMPAGAVVGARQGRPGLLTRTRSVR